MSRDIIDLEIQALIDNELDWEEEKRVRAAIEKNTCAKKRFEQLKAQKKMIIRWWYSKN